MAEPGLTNFSACCRLCLSDSLDNLKSVFDESVEDRGLQQKISASLGVEIHSEDKLPTLVCDPCVEKINSWQTFKQCCCENQIKLEQWMNVNSIADLSDGIIQIKEEPIDVNETEPEAIFVNGGNSVKNELVEEEYNELPPPLTPQGTEEDLDVEVLAHSPASQLTSIDDDDPRKCPHCSKVFHSAGNRRKHEKRIHEPKSVVSNSELDSVSQDERSQSSIDSSVVNNEPEFNEPTPEEKKILFAAGLKLLQINSTPISQEPLSRIELSYAEKCKAMANMHNTLKCACHNVGHPNLKGLLSHLRSLRIWFPVFTCYHCMITFTDRSTSTRHYMRCARSNLETLVRLSNLKKRSEVKTRLYQNFKCTQCRFMYSFHEDYCAHVDEDHCDVDLPFKCSCGRVFTNIEDYKDHAYVSCLVEFYCDICFVTKKTLDAFQQHAAEVHDNSEGFILLQDDNYRQRKWNTMAPREPPPPKKPIKREYADESNIITGKRRSSYKPPILESEDSSDEKVLNPANLPKVSGTTCPICYKEYSSNNNMWRHYKTHVQDKAVPELELQLPEPEPEEGDDSIYCCPDCGGMFSTKEWEKHKGMHKKKTCNECGKIFQFQSELDQHRSVHLNLKLYRDSKTKSYKSTMLSPNSEGNNIVMMCEICDRMFTSKEQLKEHKITHETMPILSSAESIEDDDSNKPKRQYCKLCDKSYTNYGGLWDHNRKKHPENKLGGSGNFPKQCKFCDKFFFTGGSYFMHKQMHERKAQKQQELAAARAAHSTEDETNETDTESYHTCKRCFKVFSNKSTLRSHMRSHGGPPTKNTKKVTKKVWCNICHRACENSAGLEKHKIEAHGRDDTMPILSVQQNEDEVKAPFVFTCDVCVQTFSSKLALKKHKEKHAREVRPKTKGGLVYCKYCKISFSSSVLLTNHMKEEHMENIGRKDKNFGKNYGCSICGKAFVSMSALYAHQGWHKRSKQEPPSEAPKLVKIKEEPKTELSQYECSSCNVTLPNDTALQIHILEKHRNVNTTILPARCTMCNLDFGSQEEYEQHKRFHAIVEKQTKPKAQPKPQPKAQSKPPQSKTRTFGCSICPAGFSRAEMLKTHMRQFHKEHQKENKCHYCHRVFDKPNSLAIHLKVHEKQKLITGNPNKPVPVVGNNKPVSTLKPTPSKQMFSCSICNKGFELPKDLRTHTIQAHPF